MKSPVKRVALPLLIAVFAIGLWKEWPRRLDLQIGEDPPFVDHTRAGSYAVTLTLTPQARRDHGPAELTVATTAQTVVIPTHYNYDTLMNQPAGTWHWGWVDNDLWPDVVIQTNDTPDNTFAVLSSNGHVRQISSP